jgi:hypothetical protein
MYNNRIINFEVFTQGMTEQEVVIVKEVLGNFKDISNEELKILINKLNDHDYERLNNACNRQVNELKNRRLQRYIIAFLVLMVCIGSICVFYNINGLLNILGYFCSLSLFVTFLKYKRDVLLLFSSIFIFMLCTLMGFL